MAEAKRSPNPRGVVFTVICLTTLTVAVATSAVGVAMLADPLLTRRLLMCDPGGESLALLFAGIFVCLLLLLLLIAGYYTSFRASAAGRPVARLYLLFFSVALFPTAIVIASYADEFLVWLVAVAALLFPVILLGIERFVGATLVAIGRFCYAREWHDFAALMLRQGLMLYTTSRVARRDYGMVLRALGDVGEARKHLEPLFEEEGMRDQDLVEVLSELALKDKDWPAADRRFESLRASKPDDLDVLYKLAFVRAQLGQYESTRDLLETVPVEKQNPAMVELLDEAYRKAQDLDGALGIIARQRKTLSFEEALRRYESLIEIFPYEPLIVQTIAELCRERGKDAAESRWLERLLELVPDELDARRRLVEIYRAQGRSDLELTHVGALIDATPEPAADDIVEYCRALTDEERHEEAIAMIRRHAGRFAADYRFPLAMARHDLREGKLVSAERDALRALQLAPREAQADAQALLRRVQKAAVTRELDSARQASEADPDNAELRLEYIGKLISNDKVEESVRELDRLVTKNPALKSRVQQKIVEVIGATEQPFLILSYLSDLALQDRDYDRALKLYGAMAARSLHPDEIVGEGCRRILTLDPGQLNARLTLGRFHASRKEWAQVAAVMEPYFAAGGEHTAEVDGIVFQAMCETGALEKAVPLADRLMAHNPADTAPLTALAALYEKNNRYKEALATLEKAQSIRGEDPAMERHLKELDAKIQETRFAELKHLVEVNPEDHQRNYELAGIYLNRRDYMQAIKHLQVAAFDPALANLCNARLAFCLANRRLFDLAQEHVNDVVIDPVRDPNVGEIKRLLYETAALLEARDQRDEAFAIYKRIFRADAAYKDVAERVEALS